MKAKHVLGQNLFPEKNCVTAGAVVHTTDASLLTIQVKSTNAVHHYFSSNSPKYKWDFI